MSEQKFDRSKVKGAKLSANKDAKTEAEKLSKRSGGFLGYHSIDEGKNIFRLMPPHPDDTIGATYLPMRVTQLQCEVKARNDEGEETGKTEIKSKKIFSAKLHGGLPNDPVELYIDYVFKKANEEIESKEERKKFLNPITGWRGKEGWNWGIGMRTSYLCYAIKNQELKKLELYESMVKDMDRLALAEGEDEVIEVDPFSNPDEGYPLIIMKDKNDKHKWEYVLSMDSPSRKLKETHEEFFQRTMVTDDQLMELINQKPLSELIGNNVYTRRDFDFALDGLRRFDENNGNPEKLYSSYNIFENDEFLEELSELEQLVPEYKNSAPEEETSETKEETEEDEQTEEEIPEFSLTEMRMTLRKAVKKEFGEDYLDQVPTEQADLEKAFAVYLESEKLTFIKIKKLESKETTATVNDDVAAKLKRLREARSAAKK